jgi:hypothetical protein
MRRRHARARRRTLENGFGTGPGPELDPWKLIRT